jgi:hypothetical protein
MSGKTDVLNRTWTLVPDPDQLESESSPEDMVVEDVEMMMMPETTPPEPPSSNFKSSYLTMVVDDHRASPNNRTYSNSNNSSNEMNFSSTANKTTTINTLQTAQTPPNLILNPTYGRSQIYSPCKSPYYLIKCLNIDFERVSIEMENFPLKNSIDPENYDSIFDENGIGLM